MDAVLRIRRAGATELKIRLPLSSTVRQLEDKIKPHIDELVNSPTLRMRLIYQGKMLEPPTVLLTSLRVLDKSIIHCVISPPREEVLRASSALAAPPRTNGNARGFDRLIASGMNANEVAAVRTSFRSEVDEYARHQEQTRSETSEDFRFRMEDEWQARQGPASEFVVNLSQYLNDGRATASSNDNGGLLGIINGGANSNGNYWDDSATQMGTTQDFFSGLFIGFMLGFIVLFCVWDRNVTYRHRLGLLTGVTMSMLLNSQEEARRAAAHHNNHSPNPPPAETPINTDPTPSTETSTSAMDVASDSVAFTY
jgi:hypothetical protein